MNPFIQSFDLMGLPSATDPFWAQTVLLLKGDGENNSQVFTDSSSYNKTPDLLVTTPNLPRVITADKKYGTGSIEFGTESSIHSNIRFDGASLGYPTYGQATGGNWTCEMWIKPSSLSGTQTLIHGDFGNQQDRIFIVNGDIQFNRLGGSSLTFTANLSTTQWQHLAVVFTANTITVYINGISLGTQAWATDVRFDKVWLGCYMQSGTYQAKYTGLIDDIRLSRVARNVANFTPPDSFPVS